MLNWLNSKAWKEGTDSDDYDCVDAIRYAMLLEQYAVYLLEKYKEISTKLNKKFRSAFTIRTVPLGFEKQKFRTKRTKNFVKLTQSFELTNYLLGAYLHSETIKRMSDVNMFLGIKMYNFLNLWDEKHKYNFNPHELRMHDKGYYTPSPVVRRLLSEDHKASPIAGYVEFAKVIFGARFDKGPYKEAKKFNAVLCAILCDPMKEFAKQLRDGDYV